MSLIKYTGEVKWFSPEKGYGFLKVTSSNHPDVFAHYSNILGDGYKRLAEGQQVSFCIVKSDKDGKSDQAVDIQLV